MRNLKNTQKIFNLLGLCFLSPFRFLLRLLKGMLRKQETQQASQASPTNYFTESNRQRRLMRAQKAPQKPQRLHFFEAQNSKTNHIYIRF